MLLHCVNNIEQYKAKYLYCSGGNVSYTSMYYDTVYKDSYLGHNQLIVWFTSAARPNLELENLAFLGWITDKN